MTKEKKALVTGANRGLGLEISRQLARLGIETMLTARNTPEGEAATLGLLKENLPVRFHPLDVTDEDSIRHLVAEVEQNWGGIDILVNNAGIFIDKDKTALNVNSDLIRSTMESNVLGPLRLCQLFFPAMKKRGGGRIVNLSSTMGQISRISGGFPAYRISKIALNALTLMLAHELRGTNILVNAVCPGWVKTDMGGPEADRTVEQGADTVIFLCTLPDNGPSGGFFQNRKPIPW